MDIKNRITEQVYFVTDTVVDWVDIFTRPKYKHIILEALTYCQREKGLVIYAWVLMSNHLHAIVSAQEGTTVSEIWRDFKKFTSKQILAELAIDPEESRKEWMQKRLKRLRQDARHRMPNDVDQKGVHNLIALRHIPLSPAGEIAKRPAPIALPNSCAA